jgi:pantetheine-phosphate adenylyltransferase
MNKKIAIYPGSFDPITMGHLDVLQRACELFDEVVVAVAQNPGKSPMFDPQTRVRLIEENLNELPKVRVCFIEGLTVDFARSVGAVAIIRGLRAVSEFELEFQMAQMNRFLDSGIETIFLMPSHKYFYTSSTIIKQVANYAPERIKDFVPPNVLRELIK